VGASVPSPQKKGEWCCGGGRRAGRKNKTTFLMFFRGHVTRFTFGVQTGLFVLRFCLGVFPFSQTFLFWKNQPLVCSWASFFFNFSPFDPFPGGKVVFFFFFSLCLVWGVLSFLWAHVPPMCFGGSGFGFWGRWEGGVYFFFCFFFGPIGCGLGLGFLFFQMDKISLPGPSVLTGCKPKHCPPNLFLGGGGGGWGFLFLLFWVGLWGPKPTKGFWVGFGGGVFFVSVAQIFWGQGPFFFFSVSNRCWPLCFRHQTTPTKKPRKKWLFFFSDPTPPLE